MPQRRVNASIALLNSHMFGSPSSGHKLLNFSGDLRCDQTKPMKRLTLPKNIAFSKSDRNRTIISYSYKYGRAAIALQYHKNPVSSTRLIHKAAMINTNGECSTTWMHRSGHAIQVSPCGFMTM
jgi:hypothetical protein